MSNTPLTATVAAKKAIVFDVFYTLTTVKSSWDGGLPSTSEMLGMHRKAWNGQLLKKSRERLAGEEEVGRQ